MRGGAVAIAAPMRFAQCFQRFVGVDQAQIAAHRQRLDDLHHVFVMHLDAGSARQRLVQHGGAGTAARDDEERLGASLTA